MITKESAAIYFNSKEKRAIRTIGQMVAAFTATKKEDKTKTAYHIFADEGIQTLVSKMPADTKSILVIDDIGCQLIKEFTKKSITDITYCCTVKDKKLFDNIVYYIKNAFACYDLKFKMVEELKDMEFDYIVANPPYSMGNSITKFVVENVAFKSYINLMPLSCYKAQELYKNVTNLELADPKWFEDAAITDNLCICNLIKNITTKNYIDLSLDTYQKEYREFYRLNSLAYHYELSNFNYAGGKTKIDSSYNQNCIFCITARTITDGVHNSFADDAFDVKWNIYKSVSFKDIHIYTQGGSAVGLIYFMTEQECANFTTFWYKNPLMHKLIRGLNKRGGMVNLALPRLDWSKDRDYEHLTVEDLITILKEENNIYDSYDDLSMITYDEKYKAFYKLNKFNYTHGKFIPLVSKEQLSKTFYISPRVCLDGVHKTGLDVQANNNELTITELNIDANNKRKTATIPLSSIEFKTSFEKDHFKEFWYKNPLMNNLIKGLNKTGGSCAQAIPNIDWSKDRDYEHLTLADIMKALKEDNPEVK